MSVQVGSLGTAVGAGVVFSEGSELGLELEVPLRVGFEVGSLDSVGRGLGSVVGRADGVCDLVPGGDCEGRELASEDGLPVSE